MRTITTAMSEMVSKKRERRTRKAEKYTQKNVKIHLRRNSFWNFLKTYDKSVTTLAKPHPHIGTRARQCTDEKESDVG